MTTRVRVAALALAAAASVLVGCSDPAAKLPKYDKVPMFAMTDSEGRQFQSGALAGKVWVADFIYTNCPAECPMMTAKMHRLEKRLQGETDVRFVSISVDPQRDTPAALHTFAERFGGPSEQWVFLTGSPGTVHEIAYQTFHVGDVLGKIEHSTKFVLIDKTGYIRGYYSSFDADDSARLLKDIGALRSARS